MLEDKSRELSSSNEYRLLVLVYLAVLLASIAAGLSRVALARYLRFEIGEPVVVVASLTTWFMAMRATSSTLFGIIADKLPRSKKLLMSLPMLGIGLAVYAISLTRSTILILAYNAAWGFLSGIVWPTTQTVTSLIAGRRSGTVMSIYFALGSLGVTGGIYLYGLLPLGNSDSIRLSSLFFTAAGLVLILASTPLKTQAIVTAPGKQPPRAQGDNGSVGGIDKRLSIWVLLAAFSAGYAAGVMKEFLYVYLSEAYGLDRYSLSTILAVAGVLAFIVGLAVGPLADRKGVKPTLTTILVTGAAGGMALALAPDILWAVLGVALVTSSARGSLPLTRNAAFFGTAYAATLVGLSNTSSNIGQVVSPIIAGILYDNLGDTVIAGIQGRALPFLTIAALYLLVLLLRPTGKRKQI